MSIKSGQGNYLPVNGFDMYYEIHGVGDPLILLHGFTGSGAGLVQGFKELSKKYMLIIPDLRGHGRSTNPSKEFTFRQASLDVFVLLNHLNVKQCSAVGFSAGGCTLLHMAYQQPDAIKAMAIVSAAPYFPPFSRDVMKQFALRDKTEDEWTAMRSIHLHGDKQIQMLWQQAGNFSESNDDMNFTPEMLAKIKTKTLIIQGDRDPIYPLELTIEMYTSMINAYLWIIPNGGHVPISSSSPYEFYNHLEKLLA